MADSGNTVTILDVAKQAGVSPSTVTHALNGKRPVSAPTKERVLTAIDSLGYVPSHSASHLRKGCSGIIGCYAIDITESFANKIVRGIERGLAGSGLSMLFVSGIEFGNDFSRAYRFLRSHNVDGLLLCHHVPTFVETLAETKNSGIPVISINMEVPGFPSIIPDNYSGGVSAAEHLYASGMRRPAMICGPRERLSVEQRLKGFRARVAGLGLEFPEDHFMYGEYTHEQGYESAYTLMKLDPGIDGIFCANDYIAAGAINRLSEMGYRVPGDIRIIGFDNRDFSRFWNIPISTFEQPLEEMGFLGIGALRCVISSGIFPEERQVLQSKLIARTSTLGKAAYNCSLEQREKV